MRCANSCKRRIIQQTPTGATERRIGYHYIVLIAPRQQVTLYAAIGEVVRDLISGAAVASRNAEQTLHMFV